MTDAEFVTRTRELLGITQTELADRLGVTPSAVSRWEAGARGLPGPARKLLEQMNPLGETSGDKTMNRKNMIYAAVAIVVVALGVIAYLQFGGGGVGGLLTGGGATQTVDLKPTDIVRGSANAKVLVVEYASMTCPHCAATQKEVIPQFIKNYVDAGKVKYVFRDFPLDGAARLASALAHCQKGDNYYAFIDMLFMVLFTKSAVARTDSRL